MLDRSFRFSMDVNMSASILSMVSAVASGKNAQTIPDYYMEDYEEEDNPGKIKKRKVPLTGRSYPWNDGFSISVKQEMLPDFLIYLYACNILKKSRNKLFPLTVEEIANALNVEQSSLPVEEETVKGVVYKYIEYAKISSEDVITILHKFGCQIEIGSSIVDVIKQFSSHPVKFSGSWLSSGNIPEIKAGFQKKHAILKNTINSGIVSDNAIKFFYVGGARFTPWNNFFNLSLQIDDRLTSTLEAIHEYEMYSGDKPLFKFTDDTVKKGFYEAIKQSSGSVIPDEVAPGLNNMLIPDGDGDYIAITPMPRFQVMQTVLNRMDELRLDDEFKKQFDISQKTKIENIKFSGVFGLSIPDTERKNSIGTNKAMGFAFQQSPYFKRSSKAYRAKWSIKKSLENGSLDLSRIFRSPTQKDIEKWRLVLCNENAHHRAVESVTDSIAYYVMNEVIPGIKRNIPANDTWNHKLTWLHNLWFTVIRGFRINGSVAVLAEPKITQFIVDNMYKYNKDSVITPHVRRKIREAIIKGFVKNGGNA